MNRWLNLVAFRLSVGVFLSSLCWGDRDKARSYAEARFTERSAIDASRVDCDWRELLVIGVAGYDKPNVAASGLLGSRDSPPLAAFRPAPDGQAYRSGEQSRALRYVDLFWPQQ